MVKPSGQTVNCNFYLSATSTADSQTSQGQISTLHSSVVAAKLSSANIRKDKSSSKCAPDQ